MPCPERGKSVRGTGRRVFHPAGVSAVPDLFTFIRYPGMEPTNNESERMLRKVV